MAETGSVKVRIDDDAIKGRMREFLAQAWDEGRRYGEASERGDTVPRLGNPYAD